MWPRALSFACEPSLLRERGIIIQVGSGPLNEPEPAH